MEGSNDYLFETIQWQVLVNTVMNIQVPYKVFLIQLSEH
jgi:hypothetical protein